MHPVNHVIFNEIKSKARSWTPANPEENMFAYKSVEEIKIKCDLIPSTAQDRSLNQQSTSDLLPEEFDSRQQWRDYIHPIRDQGQCGACWAFAAAEALSDRFAIATQGKVTDVLSPEYMLTCDLNNFGCQGGNTQSAWSFLKANGTPTEKCISYKSGRGAVSPCAYKCDDGSKMQLYKVKDVSTANNAQDIMNAIYTGGPIVVGFIVYEDFMNYRSGIYEYVSGSQLGGHAVKAIGWGVDSKHGNYWIMANSWSEHWGEDGFFRIKFGQCMIENNGVYGTPFVDESLIE